MNWILVLSTGGLITALAGLAYVLPTIRKMRSDTKRVDVEAAVAAETADDKHLEGIIRTQAEFIIGPLRQRIADLEKQVEELQGVQRKYRRAIDWVRQVLAWQRGWHPNADPPMPTLPPEIVEDL